MSNQADFKQKNITMDKDSFFFVMIKGSVNQEDIKILFVHLITKFKIYEANPCQNSQGKFVWIHKSTIIVGDFNTPFSIIDGTSRH